MLLAIVVSNCDKGEEFQTFLERNDGSEWILNNDDLKVFVRINNNDANLIEQWYYVSDLQCYDYNPNIFMPGNCVVRENSFDTFVIAGDSFLSDYEYMTFTNQGEYLRVDITLSEKRVETVFFSKTNLRVDDLKQCKAVGKMLCLFYKMCA